MNFDVPALPYAKDALAPAMSAETLEFHYEKHHKGYANKLKSLIEGKPEAQRSLEELIRSSSGPVFNNAAQVWNHTFFWRSMKPNGGGKASAEVEALLTRDFGGLEKFAEQWYSVGANQFGSGYVWLVLEQGKAKVIGTANAETPLTGTSVPLLTADVWEHAYYLDHRNDRLAFLKVFSDRLVNWDFVGENLRRTQS